MSFIRKNVFDFMLHYKTLSDIFMQNYETYFKSFGKCTGNPQRWVTRNLMWRHITCLQWPVFIVDYITASEQKVNNCRLLLKLLCCQKHLAFIQKIDWGTEFPSSYCSYPSYIDAITESKTRHTRSFTNPCKKYVMGILPCSVYNELTRASQHW